MATARVEMAAVADHPVAADHLVMLIHYKRWADRIMHDSVEFVGLEEALKPRPTTFGSIIMTLNHILVVDDIFRHHLEGRAHPYVTRKTEEIPSLADLRRAVEAMDDWWIEQVKGWSSKERAETIHFEFVGGGAGTMTREEITLHIVNHTTYHRGFVGDMLKQVPYHWAANDLPVFLRDAWRAGAT